MRRAVGVIKKELLPLPDIYTANAFPFGKRMVACLGQERRGRIVLADPASGATEVVSEGPGGVMSVIPFPGRDDMLLSVQGLFPPFIGHDAGIYRHRRVDGEWLTDKVIELPFAHRCETLPVGGGDVLLSATVSVMKENPADWSRPGCVYITRLDANGAEWDTEVLLDGIYRNHGMLRTVTDGGDMVCVSGAEGIFGIFPKGGEVVCERLFDGEVSEFAFFDFDGDGHRELATIEPFHGESLNLYRRKSGGWAKIWDSPLEFGHGLSAGILGGRACLAAGNRRGGAGLEVWGFTDGGKAGRVYSEEGTGTTQTQFIRLGGDNCLLAANQLKSQAALYYLND
jgi:hypothetical protein